MAKKTEELKPTLGKAMRANREQGNVVEFPSGNFYRVRWASASALLRRGHLPNVLLSFVIDALYHGLSSQRVDDFLLLREKEEQAQEFLNSLQAVCEYMWLEPRIVDNPTTDDECHIEDVPLIDRAFAFDICFRPAKEVLPFRPESQTDVGSMEQIKDSASVAER